MAQDEETQLNQNASENVEFDPLYTSKQRLKTSRPMRALIVCKEKSASITGIADAIKCG